MGSSCIKSIPLTPSHPIQSSADNLFQLTFDQMRPSIKLAQGWRESDRLVLQVVEQSVRPPTTRLMEISKLWTTQSPSRAGTRMKEIRLRAKSIGLEWGRIYYYSEDEEGRAN